MHELVCLEEAFLPCNGLLSSFLLAASGNVIMFLDWPASGNHTKQAQVAVERARPLMRGTFDPSSKWPTPGSRALAFRPGFKFPARHNTFRHRRRVRGYEEEGGCAQDPNEASSLALSRPCGGGYASDRCLLSATAVKDF